MRLWIISFLSVVSMGFHIPLQAAPFPDMVGKWQGMVRVVEAGTSRNQEIAPGGMLVTEVELTLIIEHQDAEAFVGRSRSSRTPKDQPSARIWGTIRSNGTEAIFITSNSGRGQVWFDSATSFEYCITNLTDVLATAYCANLTKIE